MESVFITAVETVCGIGSKTELCLDALRDRRGGLAPLSGRLPELGELADLPSGSLPSREVLKGRRYGAASNAAVAVAREAVRRAAQVDRRGDRGGGPDGQPAPLAHQLQDRVAAQRVADDADPVADKVIQIGDQLFGSTVQVVGHSSLSQDGSFDMNDNGDVAFRYELADGTFGIAVARLIPEPSSLTLILTGLVAALHRECPPCRRRGSRRH